MARRPTGRQRAVRGPERQGGDKRSAGQNRNRRAGTLCMKRGFAALELSLHEILLQSLRGAILSAERKARLGQPAGQPAINSRLRDWIRLRGRGPARTLPAPPTGPGKARNLKPRADLRLQTPPPAPPRTGSWSCRRSERRREKCVRR